MSEVLNLGAGEDIQQDAHNVDVVDLAGIDAVVDLDEYPWPWQDNQWDRVLAKHVLEHLETPIKALEEIVRILKPGGTLELWYPIGHTRFEDITHQHFWNWNSSEQLTGDRRHGHETDYSLSLVQRNVDWTISPPDLWLQARTRYKIWRFGPGPWLGQVPGLYGKVVAHYEVTA